MTTTNSTQQFEDFPLGLVVSDPDNYKDIKDIYLSDLEYDEINFIIFSSSNTPPGLGFNYTSVTVNDDPYIHLAYAKFPHRYSLVGMIKIPKNVKVMIYNNSIINREFDSWNLTSRSRNKIIKRYGCIRELKIKEYLNILNKLTNYSDDFILLGQYCNIHRCINYTTTALFLHISKKKQSIRVPVESWQSERSIYYNDKKYYVTKIWIEHIGSGGGVIISQSITYEDGVLLLCIGNGYDNCGLLDNDKWNDEATHVRSSITLGDIPDDSDEEEIPDDEDGEDNIPDDNKIPINGYITHIDYMTDILIDYNILIEYDDEEEVPAKKPSNSLNIIRYNYSRSAEELIGDKRLLIIHGEEGIGKTNLAKYILNTMLVITKVPSEKYPVNIVVENLDLSGGFNSSIIDHINLWLYRNPDHKMIITLRKLSNIHRLLTKIDFKVKVMHLKNRPYVELEDNIEYSTY